MVASLLCQKSCCCCVVRLGCMNLLSPRVAARNTRPHTYVDCSSRAARYAVSSQTAAQAVDSPIPVSSAMPEMTNSKDGMAKRKVAVFVAYVGSSFRGMLILHWMHGCDLIASFSKCLLKACRVLLNMLRRLPTSLFKAFRYSVTSLEAPSRTFYSKLYTMWVLSCPQTMGTCTKLAGLAAAGQTKECMRLQM